MQIGDQFGYEDKFDVWHYATVKNKKKSDDAEYAYCSVIKIEEETLTEETDKWFIIVPDVYVKISGHECLCDGYNYWVRGMLPLKYALLFILSFPRDLLMSHRDMYANDCVSRIQRRFRLRILKKTTRAALKIQRAFKTAISDPNYIMCRNRLLREIAESF